jgi:Fe-Mn family superoxide dismutase
MKVSEINGTPILGIDVWEHSYYLKYQNKRIAYLKKILKIINWNNVESRMV